MDVKIEDLGLALEKILRHLAEDGRDSLKIDHDFYWHIPAGSKYDSYSTPTDFTVGQISDDLQLVKDVASGEKEPLRSDLAAVASVLRVLGEYRVD